MNLNEQNNQYGKLNSSDMLDQNNKKQEHHSFRMIFITIVVVLISILGYIILSNPQLKAKTKQALNLAPTKAEINIVSRDNSLQFAESQVTERQLPWIEVKPESAQFEVGKETTVYVNGSSGEKDITGYDVLIGIDKNYFEIVSIDSQVEGFSIFNFDRELYQSITAIKSPQMTKETPFSDTRLIKIVVMPKMKGESLITILGSKDQEKTQLVDADVNVIIPQIGSYLVKIN